MELNFDNLPATTNEIEELVNSLDRDAVVAAMNVGRTRVTSNKDFVPSEQENKTLILLARRFRNLRENKAPAKKAKAEVPVMSLEDMLKGSLGA